MSPSQALHQPRGDDGINIYILQMKNLTLRAVKYFIHGHTGGYKLKASGHGMSLLSAWAWGMPAREF